MSRCPSCFRRSSAAHVCRREEEPVAAVAVVRSEPKTTVRGRPRALTDEQVLHAKVLHEAGWSWREVATFYGLERSTVVKAARRRFRHVDQAVAA